MAKRTHWLLAGFLLASSSIGAQTPLTLDRMEEFLRSADVVKARSVGEGVTETWRLTLADGEITHDASFQSIDERATVKDLGDGRHELRFVDSYRYNIAAYRLARLLGLENMVPVSVERRWRARTGALTWWVDDVLMDENERKAKGREPPNERGWSEQIYKVRAFSRLIDDTDRNRGNMLITGDWRIWMIDFTRAFRRSTRLASSAGLERCDRKLLEAFRRLSRSELDRELQDTLTSAEVDSICARRDLLVEHYDSLIRDRGEAAVLY